MLGIGLVPVINARALLVRAVVTRLCSDFSRLSPWCFDIEKPRHGGTSHDETALLSLAGGTVVISIFAAAFTDEYPTLPAQQCVYC